MWTKRKIGLLSYQELFQFACPFWSLGVLSVFPLQSCLGHLCISLLNLVYDIYLQSKGLSVFQFVVPDQVTKYLEKKFKGWLFSITFRVYFLFWSLCAWNVLRNLSFSLISLPPWKLPSISNTLPWSLLLSKTVVRKYHIKKINFCIFWKNSTWGHYFQILLFSNPSAFMHLLRTWNFSYTCNSVPSLVKHIND